MIDIMYIYDVAKSNLHKYCGSQISLIYQHSLLSVHRQHKFKYGAKMWSSLCNNKVIMFKHCKIQSHVGILLLSMCVENVHTRLCTMPNNIIGQSCKYIYYYWTVRKWNLKIYRKNISIVYYVWANTGAGRWTALPMISGPKGTLIIAFDLLKLE